MIAIHQEHEWKEIIRQSHYYDFYHTWYYHQMQEVNKPVLLVYRYRDDFIAFPFIRIDENSGESHLASVYGYVGPLSNKKFRDIDEGMLCGFREDFYSFLKTEGYTRVTSRLSPFSDHQLLIDKLGGEILNGKSVVLDLSVPLEVQRKHYRRNLWASIKKLQQKGYCVREGTGESAIRTFISIYWENMRRIGAHDVYLFNEQYFFDFAKADDFGAKFFFVFAGDEAIAASVVTMMNGIVNGHLIGTRGSYLAESPAKLLVDQVSVVGRQLGMKYYNLGGGLNFKEDQLFSWKAGFSRLFLESNKWIYSSHDE